MRNRGSEHRRIGQPELLHLEGDGVLAARDFRDDVIFHSEFRTQIRGNRLVGDVAVLVFADELDDEIARLEARDRR